MRKMFTRLFSLALLLCMMGFVTELSAQCNVPDLTESKVELVTDPADVCDSAYITYQVVGYTNAEYAFNLDDDLSGWGGYTSDSTVSVKEGVPFRVSVRMNDTCYSEELYYTDVNLIEPVVMDTSEVEHPLCFGDDGEVTIKFTGDHGPYTYYFVPEADWIAGGGVTGDYSDNTVGSAQVLTGPGKYYVAVQDVKGCVDLTNIAAWDSAVVNPAPPALVIDTIYGENPECVDGDGMVTVVVSGGSSEEYQVTVGGVTETTVNDTAWIAVPKGSYTATAIDSSMCWVNSDSTVILTDPDPIMFEISLDDIACAGASTGAIYIHDITGPADSSMYASIAVWGADTILGTETPLNDTIAFTDLPIGYYSVWVNNANDACDSVAYDNNGNGNYISLQAPDSISFTVDVDTVVCAGDSSVISVTGVDGGSGTYEYRLDGSMTFGWSATSSWTVGAGTYYVYVQDAEAGSCEVQADAPIELTDPAGVQILAIDSISPTCPGGTDGAIQITATSEPGRQLKYSINGTTWYDNSLITVAPGVYDVYVKDVVCPDSIAMGSITVLPVDTNRIELLFGMPGWTDTINECYGVNSNAIVVGEDSWASQAEEDRDLTVVITSDVDSVYISGEEMTQGFLGNWRVDDVDPGTYYIWAIDDWGCKFDGNLDGEADHLTVTITEALPLSVKAIPGEDATCFGSYDGVMTITVSDSVHYIGRANTREAAMNLQTDAMNYYPTGTDSVEMQVGQGEYWLVAVNECGQRAYDGPIVIGGLEELIISDTALAVTDILCYGDTTGVIEIEAATGGSDDFTYTLQQEVNGVFVDVAKYTDVTDLVYTNLPADTFMVVATDTLCGSVSTGEIIVDGPESEVLIVEPYSSDITCYGAGDGVIEVSATGGTAPYKFKVGTTSWIDFNDGDTHEFVVTEEGLYTVWVQDSLGCTTEGMDFTIDEPEEITLVVTPTPVTDYCSANGELDIVVNGGNTDDFTIYIPGVDTVTTDSLYNRTGLVAGNYTVIAEEIDGNGCYKMTEVTIAAPDTFKAVIALVDSVSCYGGENAEFVVLIEGGVPGYEVQVPGLDTVQTSETSVTFSNVSAGSYTVAVLDTNDCKISAGTILIGETDSIGLGATWIADISCTEDGSFTVEATGGSGEFVYAAVLSDPVTGHILVEDIPTAQDTIWQETLFTVDEPGTYIIWAMDTINGCIVGGEYYPDGSEANTWRVKIEEPEVVVEYDIHMSDSVSCFSETDAELVITNITVNGMSVPDSAILITVDGVAASDTIANIGAGNYEIVVTDKLSGCHTDTTFKVSEPTELIATLSPEDGEFTCAGETQGYIKVSVEGGTISEKSASIDLDGGGYMYQLWKDSVLKTDYQYLNEFLVQNTHNYYVVVMDDHGCTDTTNLLQLDPIAPVEIIEIKDITCGDETKASAQVTVSGQEGRSFRVFWNEFEGDIETDTDTSEYFYGSIDLRERFTFDNENVDDVHYEFWVVDTMGCISAKDTMTFDQVISATVELTVTEGEVSDCTTEVTLVASGGVAPYTYYVNGVETSETVLSLGGGTYTFMVEDAHECSDIKEISIDYNEVVYDSIAYYAEDTAHYMEYGFDTMLWAGDYEWEFTTEGGCVSLLMLNVEELPLVVPSVVSVSPTDTIEDNHPTLVVEFDGPITFNDSVTGNMYVTQVDSSVAALVIPITADMVSGDMLTVDYDYMDIGSLDLNATYVVTLDSGVVIGGLTWDGDIAGDLGEDWMFTTGPDGATPVNPEYETIEFSIYPNPFNDFIRIDNAEKLDRAIITNIAGQRVLDIEYPSYEIRTGDLTTGVYIITLIVDDEIVNAGRIIKR